MRLLGRIVLLAHCRPGKWRLLTVTGLISLVLLELLLRSLWGFGNPVLLQKDPDIGYLHQPNQHLRRLGNMVAINTYHQRSGPVAPLPNPDTARIMFVGDSVTFGTTLLDQTQTITELLRSNLQRHVSSRVEVLNASAGWWGIGNELAYLKRFGTMGARVVVFQIGSHDLLQRKSTSVRVGVDPVQPDKPPVCAIAEVWRRYIRPRLVYSTSVESRPVPEDSDAQARFDLNMAFLTEGIQFVREHGAIPVILHTPDRDEVAEKMGNAELKYESWRQLFLRLAERERVPLLNLPKLWQSNPTADTYFIDHVHLTATGATAAADSVSKLLQEYCAHVLPVKAQAQTAVAHYP